MTQAHRSERSRHVVVRVLRGERLPEALADVLRTEQVMAGWLRGSGVLADVELRTFDPNRAAPSATRTIAGPLQAVVLEGGVGIVGAESAVSLRAVLARETEAGPQVLAGDLVRARVLAVEVVLTVFEDVALERASDEGVVLFAATGEAPTAKAALSPARPRSVDPPTASPIGPTASPNPISAPVAGAPTPWAAAVEASVQTDREPSRARPNTAAAGLPTTPIRPQRPELDFDSPVPEAGDVVDHFAFGRCEVVKSDGDRLHLRAGKEGRIREIALEMLRVTLLGEEADKRHFKLERRI